MIDASKGYVKDGNKNRLREQDIYKIVTTFNNQITTDEKFARFVPNLEIKTTNSYNLNISRYIDSSEPEDLQSIDAHLNGGIPACDVDGLKHWTVFTGLKDTLLTLYRDGYYKLNIEKNNIRQTVYADAEFSHYGEKVDKAFLSWKDYAYPKLTALNTDCNDKSLIFELAEKLIETFEPLILLDKYDVYQVLLAYWNETMNDDVSLIIADGYGTARETENIVTKSKNKNKEVTEKVVGWDGKLIPKSLIINQFFFVEKNAIEEVQAIIDETSSRLDEVIENALEGSMLSEITENGKVKAKDIEEKINGIIAELDTDESKALTEMLNIWETISKKKGYTDYINNHPICKNAFTEKGTVSKSSITARISEVKRTLAVPTALEQDYNELKIALELLKRESEQSKILKAMEAELDKKAREQYAKLSDDEILDLLVNKKWFNSVNAGIEELYASISHMVTNRIIELAERYENTLPTLTKNVADYETKVKAHLERMGFKW